MKDSSTSDSEDKDMHGLKEFKEILPQKTRKICKTPTRQESHVQRSRNNKNVKVKEIDLDVESESSHRKCDPRSTRSNSQKILMRRHVFIMGKDDEEKVIAMQEELNQFISNDVWELVPNPKDMTIIGTKWVFRNKLDKNGVVSRNKARLVAQGYNQQEGIDYDETYAPVARLESIRILLAYACALDFKLFQMDVKSAFLNGFINEEVYVAQPLRFIDFAKPNHVYRLKKALYRLKQAPKA
ncbi:retrovirus-related pol polyprotein from transposon TNT 1-94 [Tanacetum coccineum]